MRDWSKGYRLMEQSYEEIRNKLNNLESLYNESKNREAIQLERNSQLQAEIEEKESQNEFLVIIFYF